MKQTFVYFQPEYVSKFKCIGQACDAHCCKNWRIDIDNATYKKYSHIKPKNAAKEITKHFVKNEQMHCYTVALDERGFCPMLTEDNWCKIQRTYGEDYLSQVCSTYPRNTWKIEDFFERSLTLTCPAVGVLVLMNPEPMAFEKKEVSEKVHNNNGKIAIKTPLQIPKKLLQHFVTIQIAAISILQERSLILDQRLIVLGFFFDKLDELISQEKFDKIPDFAAFYMSEEFLHGSAIELVKAIKFDETEYMREMLETFEVLYGGESNFLAKDRNLIDAVVDTLQLHTNENQQVSLAEITKTYKGFAELRKAFLEGYSFVFENYLINEFFTALYPFNENRSIVHNYGLFLTTYKILELISISMAISNFKKNPAKQPTLSLMELAAIVSTFANRVDHNLDYVKKISEHLEGKNNMTEILQSLLQG